jgi:hypothetical protein
MAKDLRSGKESYDARHESVCEGQSLDREPLQQLGSGDHNG